MELRPLQLFGVEAIEKGAFGLLSTTAADYFYLFLYKFYQIFNNEWVALLESSVSP